MFSTDDRSDSAYVKNIVMIWYVAKDCSVLMNDWQDSEYFTEFFSILFSLDIDDHLSDSQKQKISVSLKTWTKWALSYHSWRYVYMCYFSSCDVVLEQQ